MTLVDANTDAPLARLLPLDKSKNAARLRRAIDEHSQLQPPENSQDPLPALLRRWLADYAATGLPPAYTPKEELTHE
jgi:putative transposase